MYLIRKASDNMKKYLKGLIGASLLGFATVLVACNTTTPQSSSQSSQSTPQSEPTTITMGDLKGYDLKETRKDVEAATFDLATVLEFNSIKSVDGLDFSSSNEEIATVDSKGVITRKQYGNSTITISPKNDNNIFKVSTFNIFFIPPESYILGKYSSHLDGVEGEPEVLVTIEIKANKRFAITYTAGKVATTEEQFNVTAQTLEGTYVQDNILKFTITSETTLKKTFSGMFVYDGDQVTIKTRVPVSADKTSKMVYLEGTKQ